MTTVPKGLLSNLFPIMTTITVMSIEETLIHDLGPIYDSIKRVNEVFGHGSCPEQTEAMNALYDSEGVLADIIHCLKESISDR